uniref:Uncharacterized protein n=1 Tax=Anguilla anguilla TaxID=7936 RepID=A0A0E9RUP7_ANGAN
MSLINDFNMMVSLCHILPLQLQMKVLQQISKGAQASHLKREVDRLIEGTLSYPGERETRKIR